VRAAYAFCTSRSDENAWPAPLTKRAWGQSGGKLLTRPFSLLGSITVRPACLASRDMQCEAVDLTCCTQHKKNFNQRQLVWLSPALSKLVALLACVALNCLDGA